jgi:hypothetical protein
MLHEIESLNDHLDDLHGNRYPTLKEALKNISKVLARHGLTFDHEDTHYYDHELIYQIEVGDEKINVFLFILLDVAGEDESTVVEFCQILNKEELVEIQKQSEEIDEDDSDEDSGDDSINRSLISNYLRRVRYSEDY